MTQLCVARRGDKSGDKEEKKQREKVTRQDPNGLGPESETSSSEFFNSQG